MGKIEFIDCNGTFHLEQPENYSYLYFPIANETGIKSAVTPNLGGDSKLNQNAFLLEPVSSENLHNNRSSRNFWCCIREEDGSSLWSATGQSAGAWADKYTDRQEKSSLTAGLMWQETSRTSEQRHVTATIKSFVPLDHNAEVMSVEITNTGNHTIAFTPVAAIPIYGRSADNIRDHRHVTSLLHRIRTTEHGVYVRPTLSFDERGHQKNTVTYFVCGISGNGEAPIGFYPTVPGYIGEGGSFIRPRALVEDKPAIAAGYHADGKEAVGGIRFADVELAPQQSTSYTVILGATEEENEIAEAVSAFSSKEKVLNELKRVQDYWQKQVNIRYHTGDKRFDNYMRWVSFQPFLRRIYGCSFLPYHDYGKGGRGWRDLWQDCLALLMMNPDGVRQMILDNYGGVRIDGTNATIIGEQPGEFIADRNNITRVWMDHGVWPFLTTKLYIDQTGDLAILNQRTSYFKDRQVERGTAVDGDWREECGKKQRDRNGAIYEGTILEHILLQNLCAFYEVGAHNHIRLRNADWNDALDMAGENGESVAFTCAYAGNLKQLAGYIRTLKKLYGQQTIEVLAECVPLLNGSESLYDDADKKRSALSDYAKQCRHTINGTTVSLDADLAADDLERKADWIMRHVRESEWVTDGQGHGWFNSYYDNHGRQTEGTHENGIRMNLTGQVFALMSKTATPEQADAICASAKKYLYEKKIGGYRINTDFKEEKYDMGRMFGFAYGEKENGAVFSHMTVMYANALYQNRLVREGYTALQTLADTSLDFDISRMYPGIPEYFNGDGRGMYTYLTGAASWYMLTVVTESFGVRGEAGDLAAEPKLVSEQFDENGKASVALPFAGKQLKITYANPGKKDYGDYRILSAALDGNAIETTDTKTMITRRTIDGLQESLHEIVITLG